MSTPARRTTHRPVSNAFRGTSAAGARTQLRITESGVFALGMVAGVALTLALTIGFNVLADAGPELECVALSSVSEPVCGEPVEP